MPYHRVVEEHITSVTRHPQTIEIYCLIDHKQRRTLVNCLLVHEAVLNSK